MSGIGAAIVGGSVLTGLLTASAQKDAASKAAEAQLQANNQALGFANQTGNMQQQQLQQLFAPFVKAAQPALGGLGQFGQGGLQAFQQQLGLAGANGADAQQQAIQGLENSPLFAALAKQGETALLQNAAATGGLRGGNTQVALSQFRPQLLNQLIQQQFQNLGSLSGLGQQSQGQLAQLAASGVGGQAQGGIDLARAQLGVVPGLFNQQGQIGAGNALAQGQADANLYGGINSAIQLAAMMRTPRFSTPGTPATPAVSGAADNIPYFLKA